MIIEVESTRDYYGNEDYRLIVDGERFDAAKVDGVPGEVILHLENELAERTLLALQLSQIPDEIDVLMMRPSLVDLPYLDHIRLERQPYRLSFEFFPDAQAWKGEWSLLDYAEVLRGEAGHFGALRFRIGKNIGEDGFGITCVEVADDTSLWHNVTRSSLLLRQVHSDAYEHLKDRAGGHAIVIRLDFPRDVRVACEQYLLYFAQFLADVGVAATAELTNDAGSVLFSVRPDDSRDALSNVREALSLYLSLPSNPLVLADDDIRSQRLLANVEHLKGQLLLAKATIMAQERALRAQDYTLELQKQLGVQTLSSTIPDREILFGGAVAIKPLESKGFDIDLPHIWRYLRRRFGRE